MYRIPEVTVFGAINRRHKVWLAYMQDVIIYTQGNALDVKQNGLVLTSISPDRHTRKRNSLCAI